MRKLISLLFIVAFVPLFVITSCRKDDDPDPDPTNTTTLVEYLQANNMDLNDILTDWIVTAQAVHENLADYYVIDTRGQDAYDAGHIPGAVLAGPSDILTVAEGAGGKKIVVHCFKGIGATRLVTALRLSGFPSVQSMKFGMSAWGPADADGDAAYDKWTAACSSVALEGQYSSDWLTTASTPAGDIVYDYPDVATLEVEDGAAYLEERVAVLLTDGYGYASAPDILVNREDYYINNYWAETDWTHYGHIAGAYRVNPLTLANGEIKTLNPDETIVTYCWTSQTSGIITSYLTILGYDAQSLVTGANGMIWDNLESHKWDSANGAPGANAPGEYEIE